MARTRKGWRIGVLLSALGLMSGGSAGFASAPPEDGASDGPRARVEFIETVSGPTPFADNCGSEGHAFADAEVEPHLSVNPRNPSHMLAIWQQDRYLDGGARSTLVALSRNGGRNWQIRALPGISACTGGERLRASDPWTAFGADGTAYTATMALTNRGATGEGPLGEDDADVLISRSRGGGAAWESPVPIAEDDGTFFHEKPLIEADPHAPGTLYAAWARHLVPGPIPFTAAPDVTTAFSRSDDGGRTWSGPVVLPPDAPVVNEWPEGIVTLPPSGGRTPLIVVGSMWESRGSDVRCAIHATRSDDGGRTWGPPVVIATPLFGGSQLHDIFNADGEQFDGPRAWPCVSSSAVGPDGAAYVTWWEHPAEGEAPGGAQIRLARSDDGGVTWTTRVVAESSSVGTAFTESHRMFLPTVAVAGDGTVGITYYDTGNDELGDDELTTDLRFASSSDRGETWEDIHVAGPFDLRTAPNSGGYMLGGEYDGLVGLPDGFGALVALSQPIAERGATDIFYVRITLEE